MGLSWGETRQGGSSRGADVLAKRDALQGARARRIVWDGHIDHQLRNTTHRIPKFDHVGGCLSSSPAPSEWHTMASCQPPPAHERHALVALARTDAPSSPFVLVLVLNNLGELHFALAQRHLMLFILGERFLPSFTGRPRLVMPIQPLLASHERCLVFGRQTSSTATTVDFDIGRQIRADNFAVVLSQRRAEAQSLGRAFPRSAAPADALP